MEEIRIFVEELIGLTGLTGTIVPIVRHALLILVAILLAVLSDYLCRKLFVPAFLKVTSKTEAKWDDVLFNEKVLNSACHIVPAIVVWTLIPMVFYQIPLVSEITARLTAIYITVMSVRTATVFINSFNYLDTQTNRSSAQQYLKSFCGVLKIVMIFIAAVVVVAIVLGKNPMTLFAGLGATSAILMLVFKDTIEGLVAGVRLTSNNMLHRGDWITVPSTQINGIVKEINLTTVKVQNFDNTIITISPTSLVNGSFQNWIGMQESPGRRVQRKIYFDFRSVKRVPVAAKTSDAATKEVSSPKKIGEQELIPVSNIGQFRLHIEEYLKERSDVNTQMMVMVRQLEATQCGLPIEIYFFLKQKEWKSYEEHLADIMEYIYVTAAEYGLKIYEQYPDQ